MKIAIGQINPTVGDLAGNTAKICDQIDLARNVGADLIVFGELSVVGYPPRDLLRKEGFIEDSLEAVTKIAGTCTGIAALVGFVQESQGVMHNAVAFLADGKIRSIIYKSLLPTYDVFDEARYFAPADHSEVIEVAGVKVGVAICEDMWDQQALGKKLYDVDPVGRLVDLGAKVIVNPAASPFETGKARVREELFARQARRTNCPIVYANLTGGNDQLIFDGCSSITTASGDVVARAKSFAEDMIVAEFDEQNSLAPAPGERIEPIAEPMLRLKTALEMGIRDYVQKCGFRSVVLGLSGGIDSAVVAALAANALGADNVVGIAMPSRHSSDHSVADAKQLAENLGCRFELIEIEPMHNAFETQLDGALTGKGAKVACENIQARIRGALVMAFSNAQGHMALATGNKSEIAVGYCTLYGDMCGGLAPIGDVLKTQVFQLARFINTQAGREIIPENTINKPPSAELSPGQLDQDSLPEYDVLDKILRMSIEQNKVAGEIIEAGFDAELVLRVARMVDLSEFKRQQAAGVLKVSPKAFGMGRRIPIAQRFRQTCRQK